MANAIIYDSTGYAGGIPGAAALNIQKMAWSDRLWFPPGTILDGNAVPDPAATQAFTGPLNPTPVATDCEFYDLGYNNADPNSITRQAGYLASTCDYTHALHANQWIGHWAAWPVSINGLGTDQLDLAGWQAKNDFVARILRPKVNFLAMEMYDQWGVPATWSRAAVQEVAEMRRLAQAQPGLPAVPVIAVLFPFHNFSDAPAGNPPLSPADFAAQLNQLYNQVDGIAIWAGYGHGAGEGPFGSAWDNPAWAGPLTTLLTTGTAVGASAAAGAGGLVLDDFLHSLARFMSGGAGVPYGISAAAVGGKLGLWRNSIRENFSTDPDSVLKIYGGPPATYHPLLRMNIQCQTMGSDDSSALARAFALFNTLYQLDAFDQQPKPIRMRTIPGYSAADDSANGSYQLVYVDPIQRAPGFTGRDERGRSIATFNFEIGVQKL